MTANSSNSKSSKKAMIIGVFGQDGYFLSKFLLSKNYQVHGVSRSLDKCSSDHNKVFKDKNAKLHVGDITSKESMQSLIKSIQPNEIYNLAAISHPVTAEKFPELTERVNTIGPRNVLEVIKDNNLKDRTRFFQASTCHTFKAATEDKLNETSPKGPRGIYAKSKKKADDIIQNFRENHSLYCVSGLLFNHESTLRPNSFVTRKITNAVANISLGKQEYLQVGNIFTIRDWGHAKDYVEGMWLSLQEQKAEDYVFATGVKSTVKDFIELAFKSVDIILKWEGIGVNQVGFCASTQKVFVKINPEFYRENDNNYYVGDPAKAENKLGWTRSFDLKKLVQEMIENDIASCIKASQNT